MTANSKPEKHQQFSSSRFRDSASDNSSVSLHRVREAFGIFVVVVVVVVVVVERLILALWQGAQLHLRGLPGCTRLGNVAAEGTIHAEVSLPRRPCLSLFAQCQIDAQSSNSSRLSSIQKCSLEVTYGRMDSTRSERRWISKSRKW